MPKKNSPVLQKVSNILKTCISIPKMKTPKFSTLIFLKKSTKLKNMKLLKHYSYGYIQEYEFSPSNTPLIQYHKKPLKQRSQNRDIYSLFFLCSCLGYLSDDGIERNYNLPADVEIGRLYESSDEDSVDERAERFIERFYQEMRMQRKESVLYLT